MCWLSEGYVWLHKTNNSVLAEGYVCLHNTNSCVLAEGYVWLHNKNNSVLAEGYIRLHNKNNSVNKMASVYGDSVLSCLLVCVYLVPVVCANRLCVQIRA